MRELIKRTKVAILAAAMISLCNYAMADVVYEFDGTQGYNDGTGTATPGTWIDFGNRINGDSLGTASTLESVVLGTSNSNDPQIRSDFNPVIDATTVIGFQLRVRIDEDGLMGFNDTLVAGDAGVFYGTAPYGAGAANATGTGNNADALATVSVTSQADGWTLFDWDFAAGSIAGSIGSLRIDPTNTAAGNGNAFEVDYLTVKTSAIPEPTSLALVAFFGIGAVMRRKKIA